MPKCHAAIFRDQNDSRHARTFFRKDQFRRSLLRNSRSPIPPMLTSPTPSTNVETASKCKPESTDSVYRTIIDYAFGSGDRGVTMVGHNEEDQVRSSTDSRSIT